MVSKIDLAATIIFNRIGFYNYDDDECEGAIDKDNILFSSIYF